MLTFTRDIADLIIGAGFGTPGTDLFIGTKVTIPSESPIPITVIVATGGFAADWIHNTDLPAFVYPGAQISVRANDYPTAETLIHSIFNLLISVNNRVLGSTFYRRIRPFQQPFDLGTDAVRRAHLAFNIWGDRQI